MTEHARKCAAVRNVERICIGARTGPRVAMRAPHKICHSAEGTSDTCTTTEQTEHCRAKQTLREPDRLHARKAPSILTARPYTGVASVAIVPT